MANGLPVSNVVNVQVSLAPPAAATRNFGALLVLFFEYLRLLLLGPLRTR